MRLRPLALAWCCAAAIGCAAWQERGESLGARLAPGAAYVNVPSGRAIYTEVHEPTNPGEHTPVLLIHGFASNHDTWDTLEPSLRTDRRTVNVDLPGFGWSSRTEGDYSPQALAADLSAVLDALHVDTVDLVAHSWGSSVTMAFALAYPQRVRRIVLMGAWIFDEQIPPFFRWARAPGVGEALFSAFYTERPEDRFPAAFEDPNIVQQDLLEAVLHSLERPGTSRAALAAARGQCFLQMERRYRTVQNPTLLVWGGEDHVSFPRFGERLAREMPNARLSVIPRVGHFPMLEAPGTVRAQVLDFLDGTP